MGDCYKKNWDLGCRWDDVCSKKNDCIRRQINECYKLNFRTQKCNGCEFIPFCIDKKADNGRMSRTLATIFSFATINGEDF